MCENHPHPSLAQCQDCIHRLERAAALYGGNFLAGLSLPSNTPLEEWALVKQEQLRRPALEAFYHLAGYHEAASDFGQAQHYARRQVELEPWREEARQQLMRVLAYSKQRSAALAQYESCRQILAKELDIEPSAETILQAGDRDGSYRPGYQDYGQLIQRIGQSEHQSCLLLTSREKPKGMVHLEGEVARSLQLAGLEAKAGQELLEAGGLSGSAGLTAALLDHHSSNPLALKLIARTIQELFEGDIGSFLNEGTPIFGDIKEMLDQQFAHLSTLEQDILIWLAIECEAISTQILRDNLLQPGSPHDVLEALQSL